MDSKRKITLKTLKITLICFMFPALSTGLAVDIYEYDDAREWAKLVVVNDTVHPQRHNFHKPGDEDWTKFLGLPDTTYKFYTRAVSGISEKDIIIELRNSNNRLLRKEKGWFSEPVVEQGIYYIKIRHSNSEVFGEDMEYDYWVAKEIAPDRAIFHLSVNDQENGNKIRNARIWTSYENGYEGSSLYDEIRNTYPIVHPLSSYIPFIITWEADCYRTTYRTVYFTEENGKVIMTPDLTNIEIIPGSGVLPSPKFFPPSGTCSIIQCISISCDVPGATIRYTTNGDEVTENSLVYNYPVSIDWITKIRAKAYKSGCEQSETSEANYDASLFNEDCEVPLVKGDIDYNGRIEMADAIIVLKAMTKLSSSQSCVCLVLMDVNENNTIGLDEAIYILQRISQVR